MNNEQPKDPRLIELEDDIKDFLSFGFELPTEQHIMLFKAQLDFAIETLYKEEVISLMYKRLYTHQVKNMVKEYEAKLNNRNES